MVQYDEVVEVSLGIREAEGERAIRLGCSKGAKVGFLDPNAEEFLCKYMICRYQSEEWYESLFSFTSYKSKKLGNF